METKITKTCGVKTDAEAEREYKINVTFDFEGVEETDILNYAVSHLMIGRAQAKFRAMTESQLEALEEHGFIVKVAESGRAPADPSRATRKAFSKIADREAKRRLLAELEAELEAEAK